MLSSFQQHKPTRIPLFILAVLVILCFGCEKTGEHPKPPPPDPDTLPAQYGTPFTAVPDAPDAVIYQVNMRCFSATGNFKGVTDRLDSIKNLGINVIYLMPVYPVGQVKSVNSPYCVRDYKAVNPEFGTQQDLRNLVDQAHGKGMAVILDWVANHTAWDNAWMGNPDWYVSNGSGVIQSPNGWNDVAQLDFSNSAMRAAMIKAMQYWVYAVNCDGFRCDYADGPPADFWKQAIDTLRNIKTHKLLLLAEGTRTGHFASGFDYTFGFRFYDRLKSVFKNNQPATGLNDLNVTEYAGAGANNRVVRYITNHDVNSSDGTPLDLFGGKPGSVAAFAVTALMNCVPMVYNGQEVGTPYRLTFPFTGSTINWTLNPGMVAEYKKIIAFRNSSAAVRRGSMTAYSTADICAFLRTSETDTVFAAVNLRDAAHDFALPASVTGKSWQDALTGEAVSPNSIITLPGYAYLVLKK